MKQAIGEVSENSESNSLNTPRLARVGDSVSYSLPLSQLGLNQSVFEGKIAREKAAFIEQGGNSFEAPHSTALSLGVIQNSLVQTDSSRQFFMIEGHESTLLPLASAVLDKISEAVRAEDERERDEMEMMRGHGSHRGRSDCHHRDWREEERSRAQQRRATKLGVINKSPENFTAEIVCQSLSDDSTRTFTLDEIKQFQILRAGKLSELSQDDLTPLTAQQVLGDKVVQSADGIRYQVVAVNKNRLAIPQMIHEAIEAGEDPKWKAELYESVVKLLDASGKTTEVSLDDFNAGYKVDSTKQFNAQTTGVAKHQGEVVNVDFSNEKIAVRTPQGTEHGLSFAQLDKINFDISQADLAYRQAERVAEEVEILSIALAEQYEVLKDLLVNFREHQPNKEDLMDLLMGRRDDDRDHRHRMGEHMMERNVDARTDTGGIEAEQVVSSLGKAPEGVEKTAENSNEIIAQNFQLIQKLMQVLGKIERIEQRLTHLNQDENKEIISQEIEDQTWVIKWLLCRVLWL